MLTAEHREIKRIPNCIKSGNFLMTGIPSQFTLGKGHVKFFYDKMLYLNNRYDRIYAECIRRGFKVTCYASCFDNIPEQHMGDYIETTHDRILLIERLKSKGVTISES